MSKWTLFWDLHSGGGTQENFEYLLVEADEETAREFFENKYGHDPDNVTCKCCGSDYSVTEEDNLPDLIGFHCDMLHLSPNDFLTRPDVIVITSRELYK